MKRHYFLGLAARRRGALRQLFTIGSERDYRALEGALGEKYDGTAVLAKNGRTALVLALERYCKRGGTVIVNGFTCYAVIEAIYAAGCTPVYADIDRETLNFNVKTLAKVLSTGPVAIIVQNTLGIPVNMAEIEKFAKKHSLVIIEDLAHCVGVKYPDGREAGTVGVATALSFGKDKAIDTTSGGAVIYRDEPRGKTHTELAPPKLTDYLRERCYPLFAAMVRGLARVHLGGVLMRTLLALHLVEKSADNRLDTTRKMPNFEAKLALAQLSDAKGVGREYYLVHDREECLDALKRAGYHFDGFWYEKPVSPARYYGKAKFPEAECPVATEVAAQIINFPTYYPKRDLAEARRIVRKYEIKEGKRDR